MRIAQIAPLTESVPPRLYGGTERVVSFLTEQLVAMGHDVTLFASGNSRTSAELAAVWPCALRFDPTMRDAMAPHMLMMEQVCRRADEFDVLHCHLDYWPFSLFSRQSTPFLTTLHGRLDLPELRPIYDSFPDVPLVSISDAQRVPLPDANFVATVHHGLPEDLLTPRRSTPDYLAFLGRICPEKRPDRAIRIARKAGIQLKIAAKVDRVDEAYFRDVIRPMIDGRDVELIGEISDAEKPAFPQRCDRAAGADRLAGAVRPGDDRGDGLRHAGDRIQSRFGAGNRRAWRHRVDRAGRGAGGGGDRAGARAVARRCAPEVRAALHGGADGRGLSGAVSPAGARARPTLRVVR